MITRLLMALALLLAPVAAHAQSLNGYNGFGSITRPTGSFPYGTGAVTKLFSANTTGNAVPMAVTVNDTVAGANLVLGGRLITTGTGASGAAYKVHLYASVPTVAGLIDGSTYVGPYTADFGSYIGTLTCSSMQATNDGTAYWSECSVGNLVNSSLRFNGTSGTTTLQGMVEVTTGYTAISLEKITLQLSTIRSE